MLSIDLQIIYTQKSSSSISNTVIWIELHTIWLLVIDFFFVIVKNFQGLIYVN